MIYHPRMSTGLYIHIPYCRQRCTYCDFATFEWRPQSPHLMPPDDYIEILAAEAARRAPLLSRPDLDTIYFGGGTPSLLSLKQLERIFSGLAQAGLRWSSSTEITLEVNPGTLTDEILRGYRSLGINRLSVGLQTLKEETLKSFRRKHTANDTRETVALLSAGSWNYSLDLLFATPNQSLEDLERDLEQIVKWSPAHVSPYILTVPEGHPLADLRPRDELQVEMFHRIRERLLSAGYLHYEISNFARAGFESRHNSLYWSDSEYLGLGLSSHSYLPHRGSWGTRFWNPRDFSSYQATASSLLPEQGTEELKPWESLTDYCHTALRKSSGLHMQKLEAKYGPLARRLVDGPLRKGLSDGLLESSDGVEWRLSRDGLVLSNQIFRDLTILPEEWARLT